MRLKIQFTNIHFKITYNDDGNSTHIESLDPEGTNALDDARKPNEE